MYLNDKFRYELSETEIERRKQDGEHMVLILHFIISNQLFSLCEFKI